MKLLPVAFQDVLDELVDKEILFLTEKEYTYGGKYNYILIDPHCRGSKDRFKIYYQYWKRDQECTPWSWKQTSNNESVNFSFVFDKSSPKTKERLLFYLDVFVGT